MPSAHGGPLADLLVVDLSQGVAGPYAARVLGTYGARVIKVEPFGEGDVSRRWGPFPGGVVDPERSGLFHYVNWGKEGVALDLADEVDLRALRLLIDASDVLVEDSQPETLAALGLDYQTLNNTNPRLVMTSVTGFGQNGPYSTFKWNDIVAAATSGHLYIQGDRNREPLKTGGRTFEYTTGMQAAIGTMLAVYERHSSEHGQHVDVSAQEASAHYLQLATTWYSYFGAIQARIGNRLPFGHPYTILPCRDGYVAATYPPAPLAHLSLLTGNDAFATDPRFKSPMDCVEHANELDELLVEWTMSHDQAEIVRRAQEVRIAFGYVNDMEGVLADEQLQERGFFQRLDIGGTAVNAPGRPFIIEGEPVPIRPAPRLGQDTDRILSEFTNAKL